jgi:hypothetical protein
MTAGGSSFTISEFRTSFMSSLEMLNVFLLFLQIEVAAYDSFYPTKTATCLFNVGVDRNPNAPRFVYPTGKTSYENNIPETTTPGTPVITLSATDADGVRKSIDFWHY